MVCPLKLYCCCLESCLLNYLGLWDDGPMPDVFKTNLKAWKQMNPAWRVKVWTKAEVKKLWKTKYPELIPQWKTTRPIQQADIARLMIIDTYGGLYADLDTAPSKAIDDIMQVGGFRYIQHETVLCIEDIKNPKETEGSKRFAIRKGSAELKTRIANYVFWGKPGSAVIRNALKLAIERVRTTPSTLYHVPNRPDMRNPYAIIYTTGPDVLTESTFERNQNNDGSHKPAAHNVLVLTEEQCHMNNLATGTWIGDNAKATVPPQ
eukprot:m.223631 g.223631  ORF g.223631 m.223631 type:complete len:263 (+) comp15945_c0_seq18:281-1069(+)